MTVLENNVTAGRGPRHDDRGTMTMGTGMGMGTRQQAEGGAMMGQQGQGIFFASFE